MISRQQVDGIMALHNSGMSLRAMASAIGISKTTLNKYLVIMTTYDDGSINITPRLGLDRRRRPGRQYDTTVRDSQIRELRRLGTSMRVIATKVNCSPGTVHRVLSVTIPNQSPRIGDPAGTMQHLVAEPGQSQQGGVLDGKR